MKVSLVRANITYQSFFKKPLLDHSIGAPALLQVVFDALSENFAITVADIVVNQSLVPSDQFVMFKLFGGQATVELRADHWKGAFPGVVSKDDVKLVSRCLNLVSEAVSNNLERLVPLRASATVATWLKTEGEFDVKKLIGDLFAKNGEVAVGFLNSEAVEQTYNPVLRNASEGWDVTYFVQPSAWPGSQLFMNCIANYLSGGRYGTLKLQEDHSEILIVEMLKKLGLRCLAPRWLMLSSYSNSQRSISEQDNLPYSSTPGIELSDLQARGMHEESLSDALKAHLNLRTENGANQYVKIYDPAGLIPSSPESNAQFRGLITGPVTALLAIFARWEISDSDSAILLGKENAQYVADLRAGLSGLSDRDTRDRVRLLIQIYEGVHSLLRVGQQETSWIKAPLENLQGRSLIGVMLGGSIADLLLVKAYVDHANGR